MVLLLLVAAIFIFGCTGSNEKSDQEYRNMALDQQHPDPEFCSYIKDKGYKDSCYLDSIELTYRISGSGEYWCSRINSDAVQKECYAFFKEKLKVRVDADLSKCLENYIKEDQFDQTNRDACYANAASASKDESYCLNIQDNNIKQTCYTIAK